MTEKPIFYSESDNPEMIKAFHKAQETFRYFWRELSWEYRRIVPALDLACVKIAFMQNVAHQTTPAVEHMWINEVEFDGDMISGVLINDPTELTNIKNGDFVEVPLSQVSDWLFSSQGDTYGGFTIQQLRSTMGEAERKEHDEAWGLNFGDYHNIQLVYGQKEHPEHLIDHPMSINMKDSLIKFLKEHPDEITNQNEAGYTLLHRETISGNRSSVEILLQLGADKAIKTNNGKTALDFAKQVGWERLVPLLQ
ncbi:DUF2314 domain-containing protein [Chitinophaga ginsengisegetis]|uniref:DUF2314 domain-containing protein n=1 Tax=Chitinophaga ginsengisegetis TaxID=393003 RepID=UPI000DBA5CEA|nr:DUF2314 domain-containing protein [Chitinophaga ginsengisegetis]MDR6569980.1 uncharacterized protein YegJ (DUF2314 family) [Chitinophaga ginsengisegetis]MDR6649713.1 uncharacterized protein YegJ (DUF2314 family) [Chitinophaga ginsengisegetis]MDR6656084.1 uncharacterized protein YegJ (DUF2314 family) [Chitinophaga ginsengisegetis]